MSPPADILLLEAVHPVAEELLTARGLTVARRDDALQTRDVAALLDGVRVVGIRSKSQLTAEVLDLAPDLLAVGCFCIGTNQVATEAAGRRGVAVFNAPFSNTRSVAELTIAEIIALHRRLLERSMDMHQGRWNKSALHAHEVRGRTIGIVGYGHIGSQVSVLAEAIGMRVLYHDVAAKLPLGNARPTASLEALLGEVDVVTLHVPATPATRGMIGAAELQRMKPGAFLINNARGSVVDLDAMAEAVRSGHLRGGAFDVYPSEPAESRSTFASPLVGVPNVILTPHVGGSTEEAQQNIAGEVAEKLIRYLENGTTAGAVNVPQVDMPLLRPDQTRILHFHHNVPGVLSKMHQALAELGININAEYLQSNNEVSYVILDVDAGHEGNLLDRLRAVPETIRVRMLRAATAPPGVAAAAKS
jgi:D-3-phosphoglycerate dehydrogenase